MKSHVGVDEATGTDKVGGRPRPGNEVRRTLMVVGAMSDEEIQIEDNVEVR